MRYRTSLAALGVAGLTLGAVGAANAVAETRFIVAQNAPTRLTSGTVGDQTFQLGPFTITCAAAKGRGEVTNEQLMVDTGKFQGCHSAAQFGPGTLQSDATISKPVTFSFTATGQAVLRRLTITVKNPKCTILAGLPETTGGGAGKASIVGSAFYTNVSEAAPYLRRFPTGFQQKLGIQLEAEEIEVNYGGACQEFAASEEGTYSGAFTDEVIKGDLSGEGSGWNRVENTGE